MRSILSELVDSIVSFITIASDPGRELEQMYLDLCRHASHIATRWHAYVLTANDMAVDPYVVEAKEWILTTTKNASGQPITHQVEAMRGAAQMAAICLALRVCDLAG